MADSGTTLASASSRKRKAAGPPRTINGSANNTQPQPNTFEYQMSVPLEMIFRQIQGGKPLLTRAEARCLLRISMLAQEMDQLGGVSQQALEQRIGCRGFGQKLLGNNGKSHPFLRPLVPLLQVQGSILTERALNFVGEEMNRLLRDLEQCSRSLRQFSEHNWTLSESLLDTLGEDYVDLVGNHNNENLPKGAILAVEKRRLSDLEEELCNRIDSLTGQQLPQDAGSDEDDTGGEDETEQEGRKGKTADWEAGSMAEVCTQLWSGQAPAASSDDNDAMDCTKTNETEDPKDVNPPQQEPQVGLFTYPETIEGLDRRLKENKPPESSPVTTAAIDDQSKPQGAPASSADAMEEDDDDETVGEEETMQDSKVAAARSKKSENSQHSTHSVVSNHSDEGKEVPKRSRPPTQSQVQNAGEALALLAFQG